MAVVLIICLPRALWRDADEDDERREEPTMRREEHGEAHNRLDPAPKRRRGSRYDRFLARVVRELEEWNPSDLKPAEKIARARALGFLLAEVGNLELVRMTRRAVRSYGFFGTLIVACFVVVLPLASAAAYVTV